ncbi:hypothetical protein CK203_033473 [Vitis vinifera]|uniref:Uncharacterized protein n=1 Tax=Vitis vinifera TaxID=29760 RepID=A0A438FLD4_VITVI|nr:hypothetical protein CK203_033473 [Vitis vinifera]
MVSLLNGSPFIYFGVTFKYVTNWYPLWCQWRSDSGKQLSISHIGSKFFYTPHKTFQPQHVFQVPQLITNLVSVSKSALIIIQFLNLILFPWLLMTKLPRRSFFRVFLNVAYTDIAIPTMYQRLGHPTVPILEQILSSCNISSSLNKNHVYGAC